MIIFSIIPNIYIMRICKCIMYIGLVRLFLTAICIFWHRQEKFFVALQPPFLSLAKIWNVAENTLPLVSYLFFLSDLHIKWTHLKSLSFSSWHCGLNLGLENETVLFSLSYSFEKHEFCSWNSADKFGCDPVVIVL